MAATADDDMTPAPFLAAIIAAIALATTAVAAEIPGRAPGLWRTTTTVDGKSTAETRCIRAGDRENFLKFAAKTSCRRRPSRISGGYELVTVCPLRGTILKGRLQLKGEFATDVRGAVVMRLESAHDGSEISTSRYSFTSRRVGDCAAKDKARL